MTHTALATARAGTGTPPAVRLTGLAKRFGAVTAVAGLDLTIEPGEVVALLGPNGAGKSTTIEMMLGLTRPDSGTARIYGMDPAAAIAAGRVGAVLQIGGLLPDLTAAETVRLAAALHRQHRAVDEVLTRAGVTGFAGQRVSRLSGGQQQRVRFAMALVADPDLVVLDEPTTGLDVEARRAFWASMRQETARGRTVLFATHYLEEADDYADRIVLMRSGRIVADGSSAHIKGQVSGRTIRATLPGADLNRLAVLPGVDAAELRGDTILLTCSDSDAALRALLTGTPARDVEVTTRGLEDAFIALTIDATEGIRQ